MCPRCAATDSEVNTVEALLQEKAQARSLTEEADALGRMREAHRSVCELAKQDGVVIEFRFREYESWADTQKEQAQ